MRPEASTHSLSSPTGNVFEARRRSRLDGAGLVAMIVIGSQLAACREPVDTGATDLGWACTGRPGPACALATELGPPCEGDCECQSWMAGSRCSPADGRSAERRCYPTLLGTPADWCFQDCHCAEGSCQDGCCRTADGALASRLSDEACGEPHFSCENVWSWTELVVPRQEDPQRCSLSRPPAGDVNQYFDDCELPPYPYSPGDCGIPSRGAAVCVNGSPVRSAGYYTTTCRRAADCPEGMTCVIEEFVGDLPDVVAGHGLCTKACTRPGSSEECFRCDLVCSERGLCESRPASGPY